MNIYIKNQVAYLETTIIDENGDFVTGLTIAYEIRKSIDNSLVTSGTLTEDSGGIYTTSYTFTSTGEYRVIYNPPATYEHGFENIMVEDYGNYKADVSALALDSTVAKEAQATINVATIVGEVNDNETKINLIKLETDKIQSIKDETDKIELIKQMETGKWKIESNQMVFYKDDNSTEIARFNLFDSGGVPTMTDVIERRKV